MIEGECNGKKDERIKALEKRIEELEYEVEEQRRYIMKLERDEKARKIARDYPEPVAQNLLLYL